MEHPGIAASIFADKSLLDLLASDEKAQFSEAGLQKISDALTKLSLPSSLDHGILRKVFERLRSWSSSREVFSVIPLLAKVYDNLLHRDLGQPEVSDSICELLFLIEDMSDQQDCKVMAGQHFLGRLLTLAGSKLTGVRLQRTAVETLSSIIVMCPTNQRIVSENLTSEWHKLVKQVLPKCGDFFVQASIVEIFYRLSKRSSQLLDFLEDRKLREKMLLLHQTKKPDLHAETRNFLEHLNQSLGHSRSVYSFLAEDIIFDGRSTPLKHERWVHFGADHISCYGAALDSESASNGASLVDVFYTKVCDLQLCSNNSIEFSIQESLLSTQEPWSQSKTTKLKIFLKSEELAIIMEYVLPRINQLKRQLQKKGFNEGNSENTSTTPSISAKSERGFRKASVGFAIPLPRKFKLPKFSKSSDVQADWSNKACENHKVGPKDAENQSQHQGVAKCLLPPSANLREQTWDEVTQKDRSADIHGLTLPVPDNALDVAQAISIKPSTRIADLFQIPKVVNQEKGFPTAECELGKPESSVHGNKDPDSKHNEMLYSEAAVDNRKRLSPSSHAGANTSSRTPSAEKSSDKNFFKSRKNAAQKICSNASAKPMKQRFLSSASGKAVRRTGSGNFNERNARNLSSRTGQTEVNMHSNQNIQKPALKPETGGEVNTDDVRKGVENVALPNSEKLKTKNDSNPMNNKSADVKQTEQLREKILHILKNANLPKSDTADTEKQKNSTSDPIETDSEHKRSVPDNINQANSNLKKALSKRQRKLGNQCLDPQAGMTSRRIKGKNELQVAKADKTLCTEKTLQKDVFCFESDQQCTTAKDTEGKNDSEVSYCKSKSEDHHENLLQTDACDKLTTFLEPTMDDLTGFEEVCLFKRPCRSRQRKREPNIEISPAKKMRFSPKIALDEPLIDEIMLSFPDCTDSPRSAETRDDKEDGKLHSFCSSPDEIQNEQASGMSLKLPCEICCSSQFKNDAQKPEQKSNSVAMMASVIAKAMPSEILKNWGISGFVAGGSFRATSELIFHAKHTPQILQTCGKIGRRNQRAGGRNQRAGGRNQKALNVNNFFLKENVQAAEIDDSDTMANGEMQLLAALIQTIMRKIKVKTDSKSAQILASAMEVIQKRCQEVQGHIQSDVEECTKLSRERFGQLQLQLQEERETFKGTHKKWKDEFNEHLQRFKEISSKVDASHSYLKGVSDKQKLAHRKLFSNMNEFAEQYLTETEQKLLALKKAAKGLRTELKGALLEIL